MVGIRALGTLLVAAVLVIVALILLGVDIPLPDFVDQLFDRD
ncbi:hypothetical protein [Tamaricihabitans halophyticus]|nr:hypothetical protein [Tamaricihabitans halophyticus]